MLGLSASLVKGGMTGRQYVKDGLKLYMPYKGADIHKGTQFVGTGSTSFDGSSHVAIGDVDDLDFTTGSFTVSAWFKTSATGNNDGIVCKNLRWQLLMTSADKLSFALNGDANPYIVSSAVQNDGVWHHAVGVRNAADIKIYLYIDGVLEDSDTDDAGDITSSDTVDIGRRENAEFFNGNIKNVAIWERALTATEIQNVMYKTYAEVSGRLSNGLVSWWALDSSTDTYDDSHGSNDGTNSGSTLQDDIYGGYTPVIPRGIDNAPTVQADAIGAGSALFNGSTDYIAFTSIASTINGIGDCTITCWVYVDPDCDSNARIWSTEDTGGDQNFLLINTTSGRFGFEGQTSVSTTSVNGIDGDGLWTHCACVYNDTTNKILLYNNGILKNSASLGGTIIATDFIVGARNDTPASEFKGNICQMGVWSRVLDQEEIQSVMEKTYSELTSTETASLVSYWELDTVTNLAAGSGDVKDSHGSNHGTVA